jgi:hypothetical protein
MTQGLERRADGVTRCCWCGSDPAYQQYYDSEWGRPMRSDIRLFEKICLEGFQCGLSWACRGTRVVFSFDAYPAYPLRDFVILAGITGFWVPFQGIWADSFRHHVSEIGIGSTSRRTRRFKLWTIAFMPTWNYAFA